MIPIGWRHVVIEIVYWSNIKRRDTKNPLDLLESLEDDNGNLRFMWYKL